MIPLRRFIRSVPLIFLSAGLVFADEGLPDTEPLEPVESPPKVVSLPQTSSSNPRIAEREPVGVALQGPVLPEVASPVILSSTDINRIHCPAPVKDLLFSQEKPIEGKFVGNDVFVKFKMTKDLYGELQYETNPAEMYILCGDDIYNLIVYPKEVRTVTLYLQSSTKEKLEANRSAFAGLPMQKKFLKLIKEGYLQDYSESYDITNHNKLLNLSKDLVVTLVREIRVAGEGIGLMELDVRGSFRPDGPKEYVLDKKVFLSTRVHENIRAVSIVDKTLVPKKNSRVFIGISYGG